MAETQPPWRIQAAAEVEQALTECGQPCSGLVAWLALSTVEAFLKHNPTAFLALCAEFGLAVVDGAAWKLVADRIEPLGPDSEWSL